jgi:hypothetical protein
MEILEKALGHFMEDMTLNAINIMLVTHQPI